MSRFIIHSLGSIFLFSQTLLGVMRDYHGISVDDPFDYLENSTDLRTQEWLDQQEREAFRYFNNPDREQVRSEVISAYDFEKRDHLTMVKGGYFCLRRLPGQEQSVLCKVHDEGSIKIYVDPNIRTEEFLSIRNYVLSPQQRYLTYGVSWRGSDWEEWNILDLNQLNPFPETLKGIKFGEPVWDQSEKGFYYWGFLSQDINNALSVTKNIGLYFHRLGTSQVQDILVQNASSFPSCDPSICPSENTRWLITKLNFDHREQIVLIDTKNQLYNQLFCEKKGKFTYAGSDEAGGLYFIENRTGKGGKLVLYDFDHLSVKVVIPEIEGLILKQALRIGTHIVAVYLKEADSLVKVFTKQGQWIEDVPLPACGSVHHDLGSVELLASWDKQSVIIPFQSFATPLTYYKYHLKTKTLSTLYAPEYSWSPEDYCVEKVLYRSLDGTYIPLFLAFHRLQSDLNHKKTLLYGYGGFGISLTPFFSPCHFAWMQRGGILAVPCIRGGGEFGEEWHQQGMLEKKQNVFDDFIAAAEYLIGAGITQPNQLGISGASNGGLLTATCMLQRPDLYGAVLIGAALLDMLRYHLFTVGYFWVNEYGSSKKERECRSLLLYSPYHNIQKMQKLPPTLIYTGQQDDRVVPLHSYKFTAAIKQSNPNFADLVLRNYSDSGHGGSHHLSQSIEQDTDKLLFLQKHL
ncbi:MAG: prolyl oligopeptidase family serine peptidase [Chlamydiales bacterium]